MTDLESIPPPKLGLSGPALFVGAASTICGATFLFLSASALRATPWLTSQSLMGFLLASLVFAAIGLVGFAAAIRFSRAGEWKLPGGLLAIGMLGAAMGYRIVFARFRDADSWPLPFAFLAIVLPLTLAATASFAVWLGRSRRPVNPYVTIAYFFLGFFLAMLTMPFWVRDLIHWSPAGLAISGFAYLGSIWSMECPAGRPPPADVSPPRPTWPRRLRWILLAGLPAAATLGAVSYVSTNLSPIPLFWLVLFGLQSLTWIVSLARAESPTPRAGWIVQILAIAFVVAGVAIIALEASNEPDFLGQLLWALSIGIVVLAIVFAPLFLTFIPQVVLTLLTMALALSSGRDGQWNVIHLILVHVATCIVVCRGCHGDAVSDAPDAERLPEFLLCVGLGIVGSLLAFVTLPSLVLPSDWGLAEYPIALAACLVARVWYRMSKT